MSTEIIIAEAEVKAIQQRTSILAEQAARLPADTSLPKEDRAVNLRNLADFYKLVGKEIKEMEAKRKSFTAPINQSLKEINTTFKELVQPRIDAKTILDAKIRKMQRYEQGLVDEANRLIRIENEAAAKAAAAANKIAEKHKAPGTTITPVVLPRKIETVAIKAVNSRKKWEFEVENYKTSEMQELLSAYLLKSGKYVELLQMAIRAKIKDTEDPATLEIDGVRIFLGDTLVSR